MSNGEQRAVAAEQRAVAAEQRAVAAGRRAVAAGQRAVASTAPCVFARNTFRERCLPPPAVRPLRPLFPPQTSVVSLQTFALLLRMVLGQRLREHLASWQFEQSDNLGNLGSNQKRPKKTGRRILRWV
jgi:hypothetical protein